MKTLGTCLGLAVADSHGQFSNQTASLDVLTRKDTARFVNIDACSVSGLQTAHSLGFASQQPADAVFTSYFRQSMEYLFDDAHQAAVFATFRNPIEREVSRFFYVQHATWEKITYAPEFQNITLKEFALHHAYDNFITRVFAGKTHDDADIAVTRDDYEQARQFLNEFVLVGLTDEMDESIVRFAQAFGWDQRSQWETCRSQASQGSNRFDHPQVKPGDEVWELLVAKNEYDLELFRLAQDLFVAQRDLFR